MEGAESKSPMQQKNTLSSPEISIILADMIEVEVNDILEEIEQDESFSEMTAESYDNKKSYLTRHLTELSRLHRLLANQHVRVIEEVNKNCPSLIKNQHLDSSVVTFDIVSKREDDALKMNSNVVDETKELKQKFQETEKFHLELQKQVADLKLVISESDLKIKTLEDELDWSKKSLSVAKDTILILKSQQSSKMFQQNQIFQHELQSSQELLAIAREQLNTHQENLLILKDEVDSCAAEITVRDEQIKRLNTKNYLYKSEISKLEETLKSKEGIWNSDVAKLKGQLKSQSKLVDDLKKQFNGVKSDKNKISGKLETLKDVKCSQNKLIKELETRLNMLQVEHKGVVSSFDDAVRVNDELTLKVEELEREVDRLMEVISVTIEEKKEAIRQLSFAVEHYMSKYKQLHQSSVANEACCFGF